MPELDLDRYWDDRGMVCPHYSHVPKYELHYNYMQEWLIDRLGDGSKALLDFGCGDGAMFDCWKKAREVFAYDRSRTMMHQARILARQKGLAYKFLGPDAINRALTPYKSQTFDCVAMVNVLACLTPDEFVGFAKELRRISLSQAQWLIVTSDTFDDASTLYAWNHDYEKFLNGDTKVLDDQVFGPYRYIEVRYAGNPTDAKTGGTDTIQDDGIIRRPDRINQETPPSVDTQSASCGSSVT